MKRVVISMQDLHKTCTDAKNFLHKLSQNYMNSNVSSPKHLAFADRLRRLAERSGGVKALAEAAGVSHQAVYGWMSGSMPYKKTIEKLCYALGVNPEWLKTGRGDEELREDGDDDDSKKSSDGGPPGGKNTDALAEELSEMILNFGALPPTFMRMALSEIETHYEEFRRRAVQRLSVQQSGSTRYRGRN